MSTTDVEQKVEEIRDRQKTRDPNFLQKLNQFVLDANGFMTSEGKYLCKSEWHAWAIPMGMISSSFMLPEPLGLLTFLAYLLMNRKGFNLLQSNYKGHWNDVMEEYAYAAASMAITIAYWVYFTSETIDGAGEISNTLITGLTKILLGV